METEGNLNLKPKTLSKPRKLIAIILFLLLLFLSACGYKTPQGGGELDGTIIIVTPTALPATVTAVAEITAIANRPTPTISPTSAPTATPAPRTPTPAANTPPPAPTLEVVGDTYKVKEGDTLLGIAIRLGVDLEELTELNKIEDRNKIQVGQALKLPKRTATPKP